MLLLLFVCVFLGLDVAQVTYHFSISMKNYLKNKKISTLYTSSIELKIQLSIHFFKFLGSNSKCSTNCEHILGPF